MTPFDLLFLGVFLATVGTLLFVVGAVVTGRGATAVKLLKRLGAAVGLYLAIPPIEAV